MNTMPGFDYLVAVLIIAACYALALLAFLQTAIPLAFGSRYVISDLSTMLLAGIAFFELFEANLIHRFSFIHTTRASSP